MKIGYNRAARIVDELEERALSPGRRKQTPSGAHHLAGIPGEMFGGEDVTDDWR